MSQSGATLSLRNTAFWRTGRWAEALGGHLDEAPKGFPPVDFSRPVGDPGILGPESVSWRINANPVALFTGGIAAVLFELAEPRVRAGVWHHSGFRSDPVGRLRRTGMTAMVTTYGARADVEVVTARVRDMHGRVRGTTPEGNPYDACDPELLRWVFTTARWGLLEGYVRYVNPRLSSMDRDRYHAEGCMVAPYYGVDNPPASAATAHAYLQAMEPRLSGHPALREFLALLSRAPVLTRTALPIQRLLIRAGMDLVPVWAQTKLQLDVSRSFQVPRALLTRRVASLAGNIIPRPARQACRRVGLAVNRLGTS